MRKYPQKHKFYKMKKIVSLLLCIVCVATNVIPAMAVENDYAQESSNEIESGSPINSILRSTEGLVLPLSAPAPSPIGNTSPSPAGTPAPTPVATPTTSPAATPVPTVASTPSPSPTASPAPTAGSTPSPSPTVTPAPTAGSTPSPSPTVSPAPTAGSTPSPSPTVSPAPTAGTTPSPSPTITPSPTASPSPTPTPNIIKEKNAVESADLLTANSLNVNVSDSSKINVSDNLFVFSPDDNDADKLKQIDKRAWSNAEIKAKAKKYALPASTKTEQIYYLIVVPKAAKSIETKKIGKDFILTWKDNNNDIHEVILFKYTITKESEDSDKVSVLSPINPNTGESTAFFPTSNTKEYFIAYSTDATPKVLACEEIDINNNLQHTYTVYDVLPQSSAGEKINQYVGTVSADIAKAYATDGVVPKAVKKANSLEVSWIISKDTEAVMYELSLNLETTTWDISGLDPIDVIDGDLTALFPKAQTGAYFISYEDVNNALDLFTTKDLLRNATSYKYPVLQPGANPGEFVEQYVGIMPKTLADSYKAQLPTDINADYLSADKKFVLLSWQDANGDEFQCVLTKKDTYSRKKTGNADEIKNSGKVSVDLDYQYSKDFYFLSYINNGSGKYDLVVSDKLPNSGADFITYQAYTADEALKMSTLNIYSQYMGVVPQSVWDSFDDVKITLTGGKLVLSAVSEGQARKIILDPTQLKKEIAVVSTEEEISGVNPKGTVEINFIENREKLLILVIKEEANAYSLLDVVEIDPKNRPHKKTVYNLLKEQLIYGDEEYKLYFEVVREQDYPNIDKFWTVTQGNDSETLICKNPMAPFEEIYINTKVNLCEFRREPFIKIQGEQNTADAKYKDKIAEDLPIIATVETNLRPQKGTGSTDNIKFLIENYESPEVLELKTSKTSDIAMSSYILKENSGIKDAVMTGLVDASGIKDDVEFSLYSYSNDKNYACTDMTGHKKLTYYSAISFDFVMESTETELIEANYATKGSNEIKPGAVDYVQSGDKVLLSCNKVNGRNFDPITVTAGNINAAFIRQGQDFSFTLTNDNKEGYKDFEKIEVLLSLKNEAGAVNKVKLNPQTAYTYIEAPKQDKNSLEIEIFNGAGRKINNISQQADSGLVSYRSVEKDSFFKFEFSTNYLNKSDYVVVLEIPTGRQVRLPLTFKGGTVDNHEAVGTLQNTPYVYQYNAEFDITQDKRLLATIKDYDNILVWVEKQDEIRDGTKTAFSQATNSNGSSILADETPMYFVDDFEITSVQVRYPKDNNGDLWTPTDEKAYVVDGDFVRVEITANHAIIPSDTIIKLDGTKDNEVGKLWNKDKSPDYYERNSYGFIAEDGLQYYFIDDTVIENGKLSGGTKIICYFRIPKPNADGYDAEQLSFQNVGAAGLSRSDNVPFGLQVDTKQYASSYRNESNHTDQFNPVKDKQGKEVYHKLIYLAPIEVWNPKITVVDSNTIFDDPIDDFDEEKYAIVRDGATINIEFTTTHPVASKQITTMFSPNGRTGNKLQTIDLKYTETKNSQNSFTYSAEFIVSDGALNDLDDLTIIKMLWEISDFRGQKNRIYDMNYTEEEKWPIYYKPLEVKDVTVVSSNSKDETKYCKDEDMVMVSFTTNHYVEVNSSTIIGKQIETENKYQRKQQQYQYSYVLQNGDLEDLSDVPFEFTITDSAGQSYTCEYRSSEVTNRLKYYAPLEIVTSMQSNNNRPVYAKNNDTITISSKTNHEVQSLDFTLQGREIGDNSAYREDPVLSYQIPQAESQLQEGEIYFSFRLEDPAGNYEFVTETNDNGEESSSVIYDRTSPVIVILPAYNGYTNEDVEFTFLYKDDHLDLSTVSCTVNGDEVVSSKGGEDFSYKQTINLSEEGKYQVRASVVDMAGNPVKFVSECNLVINKTGPEVFINMAPNTFKSGFKLIQITELQGEYIDQLVCTLTDNHGVYEWDLEEPIEVEGKKTVYTQAKDISGNLSVPVVYDVFIDGTAPKAKVINTKSNEDLSSEIKNTLKGSSAKINISLTPLHIGDETPDEFTDLKIVDLNGNLVTDLLDKQNSSDEYQYTFTEFGEYTLLVSAKDAVGNVTGELQYPIEFRKQYILERLLQNTPLNSWDPVHKVNDTMFWIGCSALFVLTFSATLLLVLRYRKRKKEKSQKYIIINEK